MDASAASPPKSSSAPSFRLPLSTFRADRFNIKLPQNRGKMGVLDEAIWMMRRHFLNRHLYSDAAWEKMRAEYSGYSDPHAAVAALMDRFGDPYTRFIPEHVISERQHVIRGERGDLGLELRRVWHFARLRSMLTNSLQNVQNKLPSPRSRAGTSRTAMLSKTKVSLPSAPISAWSKAPLHPVGFWEALGLTFDVIGPLFIATVTNFKAVPSVSPAALPLRRLISAACLFSILFGVSRRILPIVRPLQVTELSETASSAGLQVGDLLMSIDDRAILNTSPSKLKKRLDEGEIGACVKFGVVRREINTSQASVYAKGAGLVQRSLPSHSQNHPSSSSSHTARPVTDEWLEVNVTRAPALLPRVRSHLLPVSQGPGLGYLAIDEFTDNTFYEVTSALHELKETIVQERGPDQNLRALVLDLRGNPGGPLGSALDVAALFLPYGTVLTQTSIRGSKEKHTSLNHSPDRTTPILLLTDSSTASASEILAASLCEHGRADSMGSRTVGKNVAQAILMLSDGSGLAFTVREYLSPLGNSMSAGLEPRRPIYERDMARLVERISFNGTNFNIPAFLERRPMAQRAPFGISAMRK